MVPVKFSIIIITRNRARVLANAIESLIMQDYEKQKYEIIVVDNNSEDDTALIVERFKKEYPNIIHYVFEPKIGMSRARNKGVSVAKGEILLFIDDDAIATYNWLDSYGQLYERYPEIIAWGGKIDLIFQSTKPEWLSDDLLIALSYLNITNNKETKLSFPSYPFGCNFSVKREYYMKIGGFIENIKNCNEEKAFFYKLHLNHYQVGYSPKPKVYHQIPPSRLKKKYFIRRGIKQGIGNIKFISIFHMKDTPRFKVILSQLFKDALTLAHKILFSRKYYSFNHIYYLCIKFGELLGIIIWKLSKYEHYSYIHTNEAS